MNKLVVGNLLYRPLRSTISALAVAIEVIMILSIAGVMLGMLNGSKTRTSGIGPGHVCATEQHQQLRRSEFGGDPRSRWPTMLASLPPHRGCRTCQHSADCRQHT